VAGPAIGSKLAVLLRVIMFLAFGYISLQLLASVLFELFGLLVASVIGVFAAASIATALAIRIYERGRLADIGLRWTSGSARNLAAGLLFGAGAAALILVPALVSGAASWKASGDGAGGIAPFVFMTLILLFGAAGEEMLFRGYGFQVMVPVFGKAATILPMAVLFAAAHAANQSVSAVGLLNTFAWGTLLGGALLRSGDLWMPIGMHFGWNWALVVFGVNVSGFTMKLTGYALEWRISPLWSGGDYGLEGGVLCTAVVALAGYLLGKAPVAQQELVLARIRDAEVS
jgi:membrane protease YdiL (CAAX protease family)